MVVDRSRNLIHRPAAPRRPLHRWRRRFLRAKGGWASRRRGCPAVLLIDPARWCSSRRSWAAPDSCFYRARLPGGVARMDSAAGFDSCRPAGWATVAGPQVAAPLLHRRRLSCQAGYQILVSSSWAARAVCRRLARPKPTGRPARHQLHFHRRRGCCRCHFYDALVGWSARCRQNSAEFSAPERWCGDRRRARWGTAGFSRCSRHAEHG